MKRLQELAAHRPQLCVMLQMLGFMTQCGIHALQLPLDKQHDTQCRYCGSGNAFENIFVERDIANWEDLDQCLERAERLLQQPPGLPLRLIVIDSIAHIYRDAADFGSGMRKTLNILPVT